jgi:hypothetical protein
VSAKPTRAIAGRIVGAILVALGALALREGRKREAALGEMAKDPQFLASAQRLNMNIDDLNAADTRAFVEREVAGYTDMATAIGIQR